MNVSLTLSNLNRELIVHDYSIFLYFLLAGGNRNNYYISFLSLWWSILLFFCPSLVLSLSLFRREKRQKRAHRELEHKEGTYILDGKVEKNIWLSISVHWKLIYILTSVFYHHSDVDWKKKKYLKKKFFSYKNKFTCQQWSEY
jgi:hypothetical protein